MLKRAGGITDKEGPRRKNTLLLVCPALTEAGLSITEGRIDLIIEAAEKLLMVVGRDVGQRQRPIRPE